MLKTKNIQLAADLMREVKAERPDCFILQRDGLQQKIASGCTAAFQEQISESISIAGARLFLPNRTWKFGSQLEPKDVFFFFFTTNRDDRDH